MATIYSYPRVENLTGDDVLLLSDSTEEQRTLSVSIGQVTDYVSGFIQLGNNPSAINFVSELQDYITIENNTLTISGYATDSSVNTVANSVVQLGITTTANLNAATAALNTSLTADYTSYVGTQLTSYSTSAITTQEIATATADLASASSVTELETQFVFTNGSITGTSGALSTEIAAASAGTSQAFATRVTNLEAMFTLNNANPQAPTGLSSANIQAIQTVIAGDGYAFSSTVNTLTNSVNNNTSEITATNTAVTNETNARVTADQVLTTNVAGNTTNISTNATAISNEESARISADQVLTTNVAGNAASITNNATAVSNETSARISADQTLTTNVASNTSLISTNATAISTETSTRASAITALTSTVNGNAASITTNASTIADVDGNVSGSYGVTVDANGSIAGLQLLTDGSASSIKFAADQFKFTNGAGTLTPFSIDAVNSKINLTGDVVFTSSSIPAFDQDVQDYIDTVGEIFTSTTTISGGQITTGVIKNSTFSGNSNWNTFSTSGTGINLDLGAINAEKFFIAPDGTSSFTGSHAGGTLGGWEISPSRIYKESAQGAIGLNSSRSALEIYDTNDAIVVDVNNNSSLSNITGTTIAGTNSITGTTINTFTNTNVPITSQNSSILESQSTDPAFSSGQIDFAASSVNGETVRVTASLTSKTLISTTVSYSGQWDVRFRGTLQMNVYNASTNAIVASTQRSYDETKLYTSGNTPSLTITDTFSASFTSNTNNYYVKFYVTNADATFNGQVVQASANFSGSFLTPSVSSSNVTLVADANKTEIAPGGFQVVKSASQYFRADRNGSSWITSSGSWLHHGTITQTSDINQKYNIKPIDFDLNLLDTINGYTYSQLLNPINKLENLKSEDIHTIETAGLMAQEVEKILPSAVTTTENGTKALDYSATVGLLLSIVKKLNNKIDTLSAEVESLKQ